MSRVGQKKKKISVKNKTKFFRENVKQSLFLFLLLMVWTKWRVNVSLNYEPKETLQEWDVPQTWRRSEESLNSTRDTPSLQGSPGRVHGPDSESSTSGRRGGYETKRVVRTGRETTSQHYLSPGVISAGAPRQFLKQDDIDRPKQFESKNRQDNRYWDSSLFPEPLSTRRDPDRSLRVYTFSRSTITRNLVV